jgi:hypothetical protein
MIEVAEGRSELPEYSPDRARRRTDGKTNGETGRQLIYRRPHGFRAATRGHQP